MNTDWFSAALLTPVPPPTHPYPLAPPPAPPDWLDRVLHRLSLGDFESHRFAFFLFFICFVFFLEILISLSLALSFSGSRPAAMELIAVR